MSVPTPEPDPTPDPTPTSQGNPDPAPDLDAAALGDAGKKALDAMKANWKKAEKQAASLQEQLDKINQANLSDLEKAQKQAQDAQEAAAKAGTDALRYRIAAETGITENVELILTAPDEETMRKQAELWAARTPDTSPAGPRPDLSQGSKGTTGSGTPEQDFANFLGSAMGRR